MDELRAHLLTILDEEIKSGRKIQRGNPTTCLLGVVNRASKVKPGSPYVESAADILGITKDEALALEAGFEDWPGAKKTSHPDHWALGSEMHAKCGGKR